MQYHVAQNGTTFGPFDRAEVYRHLVAGELKPTDLGWHEGLAGWEPLVKLLPPPQAAPAFAPPGIFGAAPAPQAMAPLPQFSSGLAIVSLVCGILVFFTLGLAGLPAVVLGHLALSHIKKSAGTLKGRGMAIAGLILGYLGLVLIVVSMIAVFASLSVPALSVVQQSTARVKTTRNARQLVLGLKQYAADHSGRYPATLDVLFDEKILTDPRLLEFPEPLNVRGQEWEYHGAELTDTSPGDAILLITKKPDAAKKKIVARNDGSVAVEGARE
jgi:hypothetical protein